jgi:hypothetical protein
VHVICTCLGSPKIGRKPVSRRVCLLSDAMACTAPECVAARAKSLYHGLFDSRARFGVHVLLSLCTRGMLRCRHTSPSRHLVQKRGQVQSGCRRRSGSSLVLTDYRCALSLSGSISTPGGRRFR